MNKKFLAMSLVAVGAMAAIGSSPAYAATKIGSVTGNDGDVRDKVQMSAEITDSSGSHVTIKDTETGKEYQTSIGPSWYSGTYSNGDKVNVEGVATSGENDNGHNFQITKIDDKTLRESFEGKPAWAGSGSQAKGQGAGTRGQNQNGNFVDANNDGKCDNL